jgi:hypothetical protein
MLSSARLPAWNLVEESFEQPKTVRIVRTILVYSSNSQAVKMLSNWYVTSSA